MLNFNRKCRVPVEVGIGSLILSAIFFVCLQLPLSAQADANHYKNLLVGERPAGMAGAYTAISDTPEGAFYNPAGLAYAVGKSLSVSVNAYHTSRTDYEGVLGGGDWTRESSSLVPNFFGVVQPWGKGKLAISYAVPDIIEEDQNQRFEGFGTISSFTVNLSELDKTYKFGPSYAQKINDRLSVGATLYLHYRQVKRVFNQFILFNSGNYLWSNTNYRLTETGVEPKVGLMWAPIDKVSVGLTVSKTQILDSDIRSQLAQKSSPAAAGDTDDPVVSKFSDKRKFPLSVSLGGAWFKSESLMLSCDLDYYEAYKDPVVGIDREALLNVAIGTEYYLSEKYALRGGLYTNRANTPEIKSGDKDNEDHVDLYGITASISRFTRSSAMTFGVNYAYGEGEAQPVGGVSNVYDATASSLTFYLSGSFNY